MSSTPEPKEIPSTTATSVAHVSPTSTSAGKKSKVAPSRNAMPSFESFGLVPAEGVYELASDSEALALAYGAPSLSAFTSNGIVVGSAIAAVSSLPLPCRLFLSRPRALTSQLLPVISVLGDSCLASTSASLSHPCFAEPPFLTSAFPFPTALHQRSRQHRPRHA